MNSLNLKGGDFINKKIFAILTLLILVFPSFTFANNYTSFTLQTKPGVLRNYFQGTAYQAVTDGSTGVKYQGNIPTITFDTPVRITAIHHSTDSTYHSSHIKYYLNNVLVATNIARANKGDLLDRYIYITPITVDKITFATSYDPYLYELDYIVEYPYPVFSSIMPSNGSTGVSVYDNVTAIFDKSVASVTAKITDSLGNVIPTKITGLNTTNVVITPLSLLSFNTTYTIELKNIKSTDNNTNPETITSTFKTGVDNQPVKLVNVIPPNMSSDINTDIGQCILEFNKPYLDESTLNNSNIYVSTSEGTNLNSNITSQVYGNLTTVTLSIPILEFETDYFINVKGVKDIYNNNLETTYKIRFKTVLDPDLFKIVSYRPVNNSVVSLNRKVEVVFNRPISINDLEYTLIDNEGNTVQTVPQIMGNALYITGTLDYGKSYVFDLIKVYDTNGKSLENPLTINFRTMNNTNNNFLNTLLGSMMDLFENVKHYGLIIVISAIALGVIFIVAKWLWRKLRKWLRKS